MRLEIIEYLQPRPNHGVRPARNDPLYHSHVAAERGYKLFTTTAGIILSPVESLRKSTLM